MHLHLCTSLPISYHERVPLASFLIGYSGGSDIITGTTFNLTT